MLGKEYIKFKLSVFKTDNFAGLSSGALKLLLALSTKIQPCGRVAVEIEYVPQFARRFKQDPAITPKAFKELLNYTITVGTAKNPRTVHILTIDIADDGTPYLKIPKAAGIELFDGTGKEYVRPQYIKWRREALEGALGALGGSVLTSLLSIGIYVNDKGTAAPTWNAIVRLQGISAYAIGRNLTELEKAGFITRERGDENNRTKFHLQESTGISVC